MTVAVQREGATDFPPLRRAGLEVLQVNLGYLCNQTCSHCHVAAGPGRKEVMARATADRVLAFLESSGIRTLDLTGGAPEMNPQFRRLVRRARVLGCRIIDRCNLTILEEPGQEDLAEFLALHNVEVVASLPCYLEENVDAQRGEGVFEKSFRALAKLNHVGYGRAGSGLDLTLVHNPLGPSLPPDQTLLEAEYRQQLRDTYGIEFTRLFTLANVPIARFGGHLAASGELDRYLELLKGAHSPGNLDSVMCRSLLSVDWQGRVFDCDFNQMMGMPLQVAGRDVGHLDDLADADLEGNAIAVSDCCYACTAGQGSSCTGAF